MIRDTSATDRPLSKAASARPWRRWLPLGVLACVLVAGAVHVARGWLGAERSADRARIRIAKVTRGLLVRDVVADGRVVAARSPTLYAVAAGTVELAVQPGDAVQKDQVLATVSSPELESRLAQEHATLAGLEGEVGRAGLEIERGGAGGQKLIDQAEVDRQAAARELERDKEVYAQGALPELELRRAEDSLRKAEIALAHARTDARLISKGLVFDLGTKKQALDRQREVVRELERQVAALVIRAPLDGQVGQVLIAQRATVGANAPVVTVVDLGAFELEIQVPDSYARDLAIGMVAEIRAGARTVAGRIRTVSPEVIEGKVASRLAFVGERPAGLRQNQRLTARILIEARNDVVMVERGPFLESGGGNVAYVVEDGVAERRPIRTGAVSLDAVEILSGAKVGDEIVVSGTDTFASAERVRIAE